MCTVSGAAPYIYNHMFGAPKPCEHCSLASELHPLLHKPQALFKLLVIAVQLPKKLSGYALIWVMCGEHFCTCRINNDRLAVGKVLSDECNWMWGPPSILPCRMGLEIPIPLHTFILLHTMGQPCSTCHQGPPLATSSVKHHHVKAQSFGTSQLLF